MREKAGSINWKANSDLGGQVMCGELVSNSDPPQNSWHSSKPLFLKNPVALLEMDSNEGRHRGSGDWCSLDIMLAF